MLVLSRKKNERILIGDDIAITIVDVRGMNVRVGIEAPREIQVRRAEIPAEYHPVPPTQTPNPPPQ